MRIYTKIGDKGETSLLGGKRVSKSCLEMQVIGEVDELNAALGVVVAQLSSPPFQGGVGLPALLCRAKRAGVVAEGGSRQVNRRQTPSSLPLGKGEMTNTLAQFLQNIQRDLFKIGAELAGLQMSSVEDVPPQGRDARFSNQIEDLEKIGKKINNDRVGEMEKMIDEFWSELPELKNFILPGGSAAGAHLHLARTICRRIERGLVAFGQTTPLLRPSPIRGGIEGGVSLRPELYIYLNRLSDFLFASARWVNFVEEQEEIKV